MRGFVAFMKEIIASAKAFKSCTACSTAVTDAYRRDGAKFVLRVMSSPGHLEEITGLLEMKEAADSMEVDWDDEDDF